MCFLQWHLVYSRILIEKRFFMKTIKQCFVNYKTVYIRHKENLILININRFPVRNRSYGKPRISPEKSQINRLRQKAFHLFSSSRRAATEIQLHATPQGVLLSFSKNTAVKIISRAVSKHFYRIQSRDQVWSVSARAQFRKKRPKTD